MRKLIATLALFLGGCASYVTPGGAMKLDSFDRVDIAEAASRKPAANFPARIAVVRVQAPSYYSYTTTRNPTAGKYSVVTTQELATEQNFTEMGQWPAVAGVAPVSRLLLPDKLDTLDDLRLAAANFRPTCCSSIPWTRCFMCRGAAMGHWLRSRSASSPIAMRT